MIVQNMQLNVQNNSSSSLQC